MRAPIAIAILGGLWICGASAARAENNPVKGIDFALRQDVAGKKIGGPVYVGFPERFSAMPHGPDEQVSPPVYAGRSIRTDIQVKPASSNIPAGTDFISPSYSRKSLLHWFEVRPTRYIGPGSADYKFEVSYAGRTQTLFSKTVPFNVRHCLNGIWQLDEKWQDFDGPRIVEICQSGDTAHATVREGKLLCEREKRVFTAKVEGEKLVEGKTVACTPFECVAPNADKPYPEEIIRGRGFRGKISKDGRHLSAEFNSVVIVPVMHMVRKGEDLDFETRCERREADEVGFWKLLSFHRIKFGPRCGAPCWPEGAVPQVPAPDVD